jgi:hypothetical protein
MVDTLAVEDAILASISSDRELDQYLSGDEFSSYQLVNLLYPELKRRAIGSTSQSAVESKAQIKTLIALIEASSVY